jgi:3-dehydroquinate dehydratase-2
LAFFVSMTILILNGPNLNMLGTREPEIYGHTTMDEYMITLKNIFSAHTIDSLQSNSELELIQYIHQAPLKHQALVFNPGAFSHYSLAVADAVASISIPVIEVHISNIYAREYFRKTSFVSAHCQGVISGLGLKVYELAVHFLIEKQSNTTIK